MKKIIGIILVTVVILTSCASAPRSISQVPKFSSTDEINEWIYDNIKYDGKLKTIDDVQSPEETLSKGSGVCFDMCVLFIYLANNNGFENYNFEMVPVQINSKGYHVVVKSNVCIYDPTNNRWYMFLPDNWKITTWY